MKHQVIWVISIMLSAASSLSALPGETSEDRQRDTFTLYDRNRREVNWQRQRRDAARADTSDRSYRNQYDDPQQNNARARNSPNAYLGPSGPSGPYSNNTEYVPYRGSSQSRNQINDRRYNYNPYNQVQGNYEVDYIRTNPPNYSQIPAVPPIE